MSVTITDNFTPQTWGESYPKTWGSANYVTWTFGLHDYGMASESTCTFADAKQHSVAKNPKETLSTEEQFARECAWLRDFAETVGISETYWDVIKFHVNVSESFSVTDDEQNSVAKGVRVSLNIAESPVKKSMVKFLPVSIFIEDDFLRRVKFARDFAETVKVTELAGKHYAAQFAEMFEIYDFCTKHLVGNYNVEISFSELLKRAFQVRRVFSESVGIAELCKKRYESSYEEMLTVNDTILQACNAILNNIFARHGEMKSIKEFEEYVNTAPGFTSFIDFKVGEYDYEEALVKISVKSNMEQGKPSINNLTMHVDIPDTDDRGTAQITDTSDATRVLFNKHYYNPPEVNVLVIGGYDSNNGALTPYITSITTTYFDVEIRNASGSRVAGTISWFAKGY